MVGIWAFCLPENIDIPFSVAIYVNGVDITKEPHFSDFIFTDSDNSARRFRFIKN